MNNFPSSMPHAQCVARTSMRTKRQQNKSSPHWSRHAQPCSTYFLSAQPRQQPQQPPTQHQTHRTLPPDRPPQPQPIPSSSPQPSRPSTIPRDARPSATANSTACTFASQAEIGNLVFNNWKLIELTTLPITIGDWHYSRIRVIGNVVDLTTEPRKNKYN